MVEGKSRCDFHSLRGYQSDANCLFCRLIAFPVYALPNHHPSCWIYLNLLVRRAALGADGLSSTGRMHEACIVGAGLGRARHPSSLNRG